MVSVVEKCITGFKFEPTFKEVRKQKQLWDLKVEYLEEGKLVAREMFQNIDEVQIKRLRLQLLELSIRNLGLKDDWTKSKELSRRNEVLGVVNMFEIKILKEHEDGTKDIRVEFLKSGSYFAGTDFKAISDSNLKKIRESLSSNTAYNLTIDKQCNAVTWLDLVAVINGFCTK